MIELGVNIDHVATLRQARRTYEPDPVWAAVEAHLGGADGITVHLREDRRHIQDDDVRRLRELVHIKLNLEMAATAEMVGIADAAEARDGDAGARGAARDHHRGRARRRGAGSEAQGRRRRGSPTPASWPACSSTPDLRQVEAAARIGREGLRDPHRTLCARVPREGPRSAKRRRRRRAREDPRGGAGDPRSGNALQCRPRAQLLQRAAGRALPGVRELHIGHAIVSRAVFVGLREAVRQMKALLREAAG